MTFQSHTFQNAATATGNGTAMPVDTVTGVMVDLAISETATVTFEGAGESGTFFAVDAYSTVSRTVKETATASGLYYVVVSGLKQFRVRISSYTSGTVTATGRATTASSRPLPVAATSSIQSGVAPGTTSITQVTALQYKATDAVYRAQRSASRDAEDGDYMPATGSMGYAGTNSWDRLRVANVVKDIASTAVTAGTPVTVWTPTAGKKFRLLGWSLSLSVAGSIIFKYGAGSVTLFRTPAVAAAGITDNPPGFGNGTMPNAANDVLKIDVTASGNVAGFVFGMEE